jgi:hypothetical protein
VLQFKSDDSLFIYFFLNLTELSPNAFPIRPQHRKKTIWRRGTVLHGTRERELLALFSFSPSEEGSIQYDGLRVSRTFKL